VTHSRTTYDRDRLELGTRAALDLDDENDPYSRNTRARSVAWRANRAVFRSESNRIARADFGYDD
jgi:cation transport regulator ChaB